MNENWKSIQATELLDMVEVLSENHPIEFVFMVPDDNLQENKNKCAREFLGRSYKNPLLVLCWR